MEETTLFNGKRKIKNRAALEVVCCGRTHTILSNRVEADKVCIRMFKEQSCNMVFAGDKIHYKVTICNDSDIDLCGLALKDELDDGTTYENNSFCYNGKKVCPVVNDGTIYYTIPEIKANCQAVITFDVEIK